MDKRDLVVPGEPASVTRNGRRYFGKAHRAAVVAKCLVPGASLAAVALANGLNANLVRKWVRQWQARNTVAGTAAKLLPVTIQAETERTRVVSESTVSGRSAQRIKRADVGSMQLRVGAIELVLYGTVEREQLSVVLDALLRTR